MVEEASGPSITETGQHRIALAFSNATFPEMLFFSHGQSLPGRWITFLLFSKRTCVTQHASYAEAGVSRCGVSLNRRTFYGL